MAAAYGAELTGYLASCAHRVALEPALSEPTPAGAVSVDAVVVPKVPEPQSTGAPSEVSLSFAACTETADEPAAVCISMQTPVRATRDPCDICFVVDVSGSMGSEAVVEGAGQSTGLSVLDVVKHSMRTIVRNLGEEDRLALVTYANDAQKVFDLTRTDDAGKMECEAKLETLHPAGMTNLWDGLKSGIETLKAGQRLGRLQHVMLFTDGLPNINPPRGILPMVDRLKAKEGGRLPCTISTFGFGYELDSELLVDLATAGSGCYGFIPDAGFVGTVFVNAMANLLVTMAKDAVLTLRATGGAFVPGDGRFPSAKTPVVGGMASKLSGEELLVNVGSLQFGQTKDVVVRMSLPEGARLWASLAYVGRHGPTLPVVCEEPVQVAPTLRADVELCRLTLCEAIRSSVQALRQTKVERAHMPLDLDLAQRLVAIASAKVRSVRERAHGDELQELDYQAEDLSGQVTEAISKAEWYTRWGVHYLPSLMLAHISQTCTNFKDPGVQNYGGELFLNIRDAADDLFCNLPPPQPSARPAPLPMPTTGGMVLNANPAPAAPVSMSMYYNSYGG